MNISAKIYLWRYNYDADRYFGFLCPDDIGATAN